MTYLFLICLAFNIFLVKFNFPQLNSFASFVAHFMQVV